MLITGSCVCIRRNLLFHFGTTPLCETQCGLSTFPANTRRWPDAGPMLATVCDAGPALNQHWFNTCVGLRWIAHWSGSAHCWRRVQADTDLMSVKWWALVSTSCWRYRHDALNQGWVNVGPRSVTLAHIQRGPKHEYWANVGSAS